mmetsp:Transcript_23064/g.70641  ORF Transcript_23064/g.70641 Transcript_23064/m.70641 type:complete len:233 (+) Transcript_23064:1317-2015(+)
MARHHRRHRWLLREALLIDLLASLVALNVAQVVEGAELARCSICKCLGDLGNGDWRKQSRRWGTGLKGGRIQGLHKPLGFQRGRKEIIHLLLASIIGWYEGALADDKMYHVIWLRHPGAGERRPVVIDWASLEDYDTRGLAPRRVVHDAEEDRAPFCLLAAALLANDHTRGEFRPDTAAISVDELLASVLGDRPDPARGDVDALGLASRAKLVLEMWSRNLERFIAAPITAR